MEAHTKYIIDRYDKLLGSVNTKGSFLLAFNTFIIGGLLSIYKDLISFFAITGDALLAVKICTALLVIVGLIATIRIIQAVFPFLSSGCTADKYYSLIYFNTVQSYKNADLYHKALTNQLKEEKEEDLAKQAYILAKGLNKKFNHINDAIYCIYFEIFLVFIHIVIIIIS